MTSLEHRILIPTPPQPVWEYISDLQNNREWQTDCEGIVYLSQKRKGVGTRWRQQATNRAEYVFEVSTWYDGLGYEYVLIDGAPFKEVRGRVRLQEIPEGTLVQWTFAYELGGGVFGGLRNALSTERRQDTLMVDSLKALYKQARRMGSMDTYESRALMRDGVQDPESRATYRSSRSPLVGTSTEVNGPEKETVETGVVSTISEPPISDEDTRPRPSVIDADTLPSHQDETPTDETPTDETPTVEETINSPDEHARFAPPERTPEKASSFSELMASYRAETATEDDPETPPLDPVETNVAQDETLPSRDTITDEAAIQEQDDAQPIEPTVPLSAETSEMSIWEVFGIPSPTDSQQIRAIQVSEEAEAEYEAEEAEVTEEVPVAEAPAKQVQEAGSPPYDAAASVGRAGARTRARRRMVRVRRPGE